jgi:hypothetical protein
MHAGNDGGVWETFHAFASPSVKICLSARIRESVNKRIDDEFAISCRSPKTELVILRLQEPKCERLGFGQLGYP